mmetsp:Transcript_58319/g.126790  ORF Transcript_58319/g.126790 Transcript_58319/m.126790 type:complete len:113 (-) Transcript_58319:61-399(-)
MSSHNHFWATQQLQNPILDLETASPPVGRLLLICSSWPPLAEQVAKGRGELIPLPGGIRAPPPQPLLAVRCAQCPALHIRQKMVGRMTRLGGSKGEQQCRLCAMNRDTFCQL